MIKPDLQTKISLNDLRGWDEDYTMIQPEAHERQRELVRAKADPERVTPAQARKNAWSTIFGRGVMRCWLYGSI